MRKIALFAALALVAVVSAHAEGTVPTEIQGAIDTGTAVFTAVKTLAVAIVVFAIGKRLVTRFSK